MYLTRLLLVFFIGLGFFYSQPASADRCPSPDIIKDRKISREYAWLIDERRSLEDVLIVERLYSVRIKNKGEFASCYYSADQHLLQMDARPLKPGCIVIEYGGKWKVVNSAEKVCAEEDVYQCQYAIYCDESSDKIKSPESD